MLCRKHLLYLRLRRGKGDKYKIFSAGYGFSTFPFSCSSAADTSFGRDENYPAPADVTVFDVLLENNAVVHPWPTPDFPDGLTGIDMTKTICEDYVYAYKFPVSTNGDGLDALSVCPAVFMFALSHCG